MMNFKLHIVLLSITVISCANSNLVDVVPGMDVEAVQQYSQHLDYNKEFTMHELSHALDDSKFSSPGLVHLLKF